MDKEQINNKITQTKKLLKAEAEGERSFLRILTAILGFSNIVLGIILIIVLSSKNYFVIQSNGEVNKLKEQKLNLSYDMLYKFADTVIINTFNYSYLNIENVFDRITPYYTTVGLADITKAFKDSNLITYTKEYKVTKSTVPTNEVYKVIPSTFGIDIFRSYASEEISKNERKTFPSVIYEINIIKQTGNNSSLYKLRVNTIKEYTYKEYQKKMGYTSN